MIGEVTLHNYCEGNYACPLKCITPDTSAFQLWGKVTKPLRETKKFPHNLWNCGPFPGALESSIYCWLFYPIVHLKLTRM
jgi:hypothetical protein